MKKTLLSFICLFFALFSTAHAYSPYSYLLRSGTYQLSGGNTKWNGGAYQGEVVIQPQGENYSVVWFIGSSQAQIGVGILENDILSVAFQDLSNATVGVVSFRIVADGELEGKWTSLDGYSQKPEYLVWKSYFTY
ncbi:MAG: hypothetical protein V4487_05345 [Chlamydiota bacterium]